MNTTDSRWDLTIEGFDVETCYISYIDIKFTLKFYFIEFFDDSFETRIGLYYHVKYLKTVIKFYCIISRGV